MDVAEHEAGPRDARRQLGERAPRQRRLRTPVQDEPPQERGAVDHGEARIARAHHVPVEDLERARRVSALELEERQVPDEVAVEGRAPVVVAEPVGQERRALVVAGRLEHHVGDVVAGVGVARMLGQRALGQDARLLEPSHLVVRERERGLIPPVVPVSGRQPLDERAPVLLAIRAAREADAAARLVHQRERPAGTPSGARPPGRARAPSRRRGARPAPPGAGARAGRHPPRGSRARSSAARAVAPSPRTKAQSATPAWASAKSGSAVAAAPNRSSASGP